MDDQTTSALRGICAVLHDVTEQAFHAHKLAEQAYQAAIGAKAPDDAHIQSSKEQILRVLRSVTEQLR
jgi:hypothetical protein